VATLDRPTEFGGKVQRNGIQPPKAPLPSRSIPTGHVPYAYELLRLQYQTGQTADSTRAPDKGEAFAGIEPLDVAMSKRRAEGIAGPIVVER
jgi:hypothetical protein